MTRLKISMLCGSLEPGRDGVGDYVWSLAAGSQAQDAVLQVIALNDPYVSSTTRQEQAGAEIIRYPAGKDYRSRWTELESDWSRFSPDWISLHWVGYAYYRRGLVGDIGRQLRRLAGKRHVHLMFHELWMSSGSWRQTLLHWAQRRGLRKLLRELQPDLVQSTTNHYLALLRKEGQPATRLPLFSSIPVAEKVDETDLAQARLEQGERPSGAGREETVRGVFFGSIYPGCPAEKFFPELAQAARFNRQRLEIFHLGRMSDSSRAFWLAWKKNWGKQMAFIALGEQPAARLSSLLQLMDFGLAVTPAVMLGKSSSAVTILEHGLPLILLRDEVTALAPADDFGSRQSLLWRWEEGLAENLARVRERRQSPQTGQEKVSREWLEKLREIGMGSGRT
jgi:hypothetical protein